ncbi:MAG: GAF domain-containing protein [Anaerolineaceae bacterium]|nr:GAF domain-containing protein [Anaerolineaceae bacterium]
MSQSLRILLVDDEVSILTPLAKYLRGSFNYEVDTAPTAAEALEQLQRVQGNYQVVLIDDLLMPEPGAEPEPLGVILTQKIKTSYPSIEIIVFTGWGMESALETLQAGAYRYLAKPLNYQELDILVRMAAEQSQLKNAAREKQILEKLMETSAALLNGQDLSQTLAIVLQGVQSIGFDRVRLYLLAEDGQAMVGTAQVGMTGGFVGFRCAVSADDYMREVMADPQSRLYERKAGEVLPYEVELDKQDVNQWVCMPLVVEGRIIGKLSMDNKHSRRFIATTELEPLKLFAAQAAAAIYNAQLRANEQAARQQAERRARNLEVIQQVSSSLNSTLEVDKILTLVCRAAVDLIKADHSGLVLFKAPAYTYGEVVAEYPAIGTSGVTIQVEGIPLQEGLITNGEPVVLSEITDKAALGPAGAVFDQFDIRSVVIVPVVLKERIIGTFSLDAIGRTHQFTAEEVDLCQTFASQVAMAVGNSRAHKAVKRYAEQLDVLHKISDYIQTSQDIDKILHVVLTGVTAGYGLGFNRAALFLLDESGENLVGRMGIGHLDAAKAQANWEHLVADGLPGFDQFLNALEGDHLRSTPINDHIRHLCLPLDCNGSDIFSRAVYQGKYCLLTDKRPESLPASFALAFKPARPLIVAPLLARDQVIGVLVADNKFTQLGISESDIEAVLTFANTAAIAIDNTRLLAETRIATERLSSFFEASNALVSSPDPDKVMYDILELACVAAEANGASLILGNPLRQVSVGVDEQVNIKDVIRPNGLSAKVMQSGHYAVIENVVKERHRVNPSLFSNNIRAALCFPVAVEGKRIGVMWIHYNQPRRFAKAEVEALQLYVNQAGIAFDSAQRMKELEYMRRAAEALAGAAELAEVLDQIVHSAREILQAASTAIWSYDPVREKFNFNNSAADGLAPEIWDKYRQNEAQCGQTPYAIMEHGWVGVENVDILGEYGYLGDPTRKLLEEIGARSFQGVALTVGSEKLGVLFINYERPRRFSDKDRETVKTFANHAALALKNAMLMDQLRKLHNSARVVARVTLLEDLQKTLRHLVEGTLDAFGCDATVLFTFDHDTQKLGHPPILTGVNYPERTRVFTQVPQDSFVRDLVERDAPYIVEQAPDDPIFANRRFLKDEGVRSCIALPLRVGSRKVGIMFVNYRQFHRFTPEEVKYIEFFANQAAVAIRNAQLFEEQQKQANILQVLHQTGRTVGNSLNLDEILENILEQAQYITHYQGKQICFASMRLVEAKSARIVSVYPQQEIAPSWQVLGIDHQSGSASQLPKGITWRTVTSKKPQLIKDVTRDPDYVSCHPATRSELDVPIMLGDEVIGVINVEHSEFDAFDERDQQALQTLADQAAVAIRNARLFEEVQRKAQLLSMAAQVARRTTSILDIDKLLTETGRLITDSFGFYHTGVFLFDSKRENLELQAIYPANTSPLRLGHTLKIGQGVVGTAAQSGLAQLAPDVTQNGHYVATLPLTRAEMAFPLIARNQVMGVLDLQSTSVGDWNDEDIATLQIMADQLANAIINAQLYQAVTERLKEANILRQVAVSLAGTSELSEVLNLVLTEAIKLTDTNEGVVLFWDSQHEEITQGFKVNIHQGLQFYPSRVRKDDFTRTIIEQRTPLFIADTQQDGQANPVLVEKDYRAILGVPLLSQNNVIGVLCVRSKDTKQFSEREIALLEILAGQFAVAIDRASQYEEMKKIKGFIGTHTAVDWIRMVSTTWGHSIKREVGTARGHVALLKALLPKEQQTVEIGQQLEQLDTIINGIKDIPVTAPLSYEDAINSLKINETFRTYLERRWRQNRYKTVALRLKLEPELDNVATVRASQEWLRRGFELIIDNAVYAMEQANSPEKQITIITRLVNRQIRVFVEDTGPGIPETLRNKIFNQPIDKPEGSKGSGIGLMLARTIFQTYYGDVDIHQTTQQGTSVIVTLPVETIPVELPKVSVY